MRIKLNKPWQLQRPGDVMEVHRPVGEVLVNRGIASRFSLPKKAKKTKGVKDK
jgi:hypothetical protein